MESVMNFLAANYIWFFVIAGILCFALVGFIIDSKRKKKDDFKGESVEAPVASTPYITGETVDLGVEAPVESMSASEMAPMDETPAPVEPTQMVNASTKNLNDTMQINDIPMNLEEDANLNEVPINPELASFGEPISMDTMQTVEEPLTEPVPQTTISNISQVSTEEAKPIDDEIEMFEDLK